MHYIHTIYIVPCMITYNIVSMYFVCTERCNSWFGDFLWVCSICYQSHQSHSAWAVSVVRVLSITWPHTVPLLNLSWNVCIFRGCAGQFFVPLGDPIECASQCQNPPMCGPIQIPEEHLKVRLVRMFCMCYSLYQVIIFLQQLIVDLFLYTN